MSRLALPLLALAATLSASPDAARAQVPEPFGGPAAFGEWIETDGARVRVLVGSVEADGRVEGAVEIDLEPGWKTYWIAPGPTGIPPQFDVAGSRNVGLTTVRHPAPTRFSDAYGTSVGYEADVAFAIDLRVPDPGTPARLRLGGFIGVCDEICVPLAFVAEGEVAGGRSLPMDVTLPIGRARMSLPFDGVPGALTATVAGGYVAVDGLPAGAEAFVAPPSGVVLGEGNHADGTWRAEIRRGEPSGDLTVIVRDGAMETLHRVPLDG